MNAEDLLEMVDVAHRLRSDGVIVRRIGWIDGELVVVAIGVADGARGLASILDANGHRDPRSTDQPDPR